MEQAIKQFKSSRLSGLWANVPGCTLVERLIDVVAARQRLRLIVTSDGYFEIRILWGVIELNKGARQEFLIEGGPGFCEAALRSLEGSKKTVRVISRIVGNRGVLD